MKAHRHWLEEQLSRVIARAREYRAQIPTLRLWLFFRRGELLVTAFPECSGYERVTPIPLPEGKSDADLREWIAHELKGVPCFP